jgi:streptothricin hydrolase
LSELRVLTLGGEGAVDEPGTSGWELHFASVEPGRDEVIIRKRSDDGFAGAGLIELLNSRGLYRVVIEVISPSSIVRSMATRTLRT